jgi:hypothetical protein
MRKTESAVRGQTIITESSPDRSSHTVKDTMGRKCGGGPMDVSHSLSGAGQVEDYNDKKSGKKASSGY